MTKYLFFLMLLIISCQNNWSVQEKDDFKKRCQMYKTSSHNNEDYEKFCECILKKSIDLNLSYIQFLEVELTNAQTDEIIKPCLNIP